MKNDLFRKEAVEKITGPEDLNSYIKVLSPKIWLILIGVAIAIAAMIIFVVSTGYPIWNLFSGNRI